MRYISFLILLFFLSCTNSETELSAIQEAEDATMQRDSIENALVETMEEIDRNLDQIRKKQGIISLAGSDENISKRAQILDNISLINSLIEDNRKKIDELTIQSRLLGNQNNTLSRIVAQARQRIIKQEEEIASLKAQLETESFKVVELNQKISEMESDNRVLSDERSVLEEGNARLDKDLNKAWFAYGTSSELEEKKLVEKKGGVLGIGQKDELSQSFYKNKSYFTEIDIRNTTNIPIYGKKPKLLSAHPKNSYDLTESPGTETYYQIIIKDTEAFWSMSRFLVVEVK